jgi:hypothetical protein
MYHGACRRYSVSRTDLSVSVPGQASENCARRMSCKARTGLSLAGNYYDNGAVIEVQQSAVTPSRACAIENTIQGQECRPIDRHP